jgi:peroxidase
VSSDPATQAALKQAYGTVDKIDLWTGGLAEDHVAGAVVGQTFGLIIGRQFAALRDGDRLYFENQGFDQQTLNAIKHTTLSDLILRDTDTTSMQADAFVATERHSGTLAGIDPTGADAAEGMAQLVVGSKGVDTLTAGDLGDTLYAASGRMTMTGGKGGDTFVFDFEYIKGKGNTATITDFDPREDDLQFLGGHTKIIETSDHHGGTLLMVNGETIHLLGVKTTDVHVHDHFMV